MEYKYFIEYLGVLVIVTANLLTNADPVIIGLIYFAVLTTANNMSTGFFNPFIPLGMYILGRTGSEEAMYNILAQVLGALSAILVFKPIKIYID
jgi:glycerol uptake facilitator-like aquaporin